MAKQQQQLPIRNFLFLVRRSRAVATETVSGRSPVASTMTNTKDLEQKEPVSGRSPVISTMTKTKDLEQKDRQIFWMKDPKTGNWIPENHFNETDVADLREKLLPKPHKLQHYTQKT